MLTIKTKQIDGYTVITGAGQLTIDPESTKKANAQEIFDLPESVDMRKKSDEKMAHITNSGYHKKTARFYKPDKDNQNSDAKKYKDHDDKYKFAISGINVCDAELKEMIRPAHEKAKGILRSKPIYNEPGTGEYISAGLKIVGPDDNGQPAVFTDEELQERGLIADVDNLIGLHLSRGPNQACDIDGKYLPDYREKEIWFQDAENWMKLDPITEIGIDISEDGIIYEDLAPEQRVEVDEKKEIYRVEALTPEQRAVEKAEKIDQAADQAAAMKAKLEIQGSTPAGALTESRAWYDEQVVAIGLKYG